MRKRSSYRPRPVILDTLNWVKSGFKPLVSIADENVKLRLKNRMALDAVMHGDATEHDLDVLIAVSNIATALSRTHGADWREEIRAAADAIEQMQVRYVRWKKVQATPTELEVVELMFHIHDAQLDASRINDLEQAIALTKRKVAAVWPPERLARLTVDQEAQIKLPKELLAEYRAALVAQGATK